MAEGYHRVGLAACGHPCRPHKGSEERVMSEHLSWLR
jgi:hypothetical protein